MCVKRDPLYVLKAAHTLIGCDRMRQRAPVVGMGAVLDWIDTKYTHTHSRTQTDTHTHTNTHAHTHTHTHAHTHTHID